jgi:predicted ribosomally synthesized peptide with SipW-like signal peptide
MKHKKLLIVLAVIVVMAVAAAVAYAWWSDTATTNGNSVSTGSVNLESDGGAIVAAGLMPQTEPAIDANDDAYGAVSYAWVHNASTAPLMFYGWLGNGTGDTVINPYVRVRIWLLGATTAPAWWTGYPSAWVDTFQIPGPHLSFNGTLEEVWTGEAGGRNYLSSRYWDGAWHQTPIGVDEWGTYRIAIWLDSSAPNETQGKQVDFSVNWTGMQIEGWDAAGYDSQPFEDPFTP